MKQMHLLFWGMAILTATLQAAPVIPDPTTLPANAPLDSVAWGDEVLTLREVTVKASFAPEKKSALQTTTVRTEQLRQNATAQNFPELLGSVPSLYATSSTGNYGDATVNLRGFKQENVAVLLNGIPISGVTSGSMYWSNWMGLSDATYAVQVQKGISRTMLSDNAVGGSINIITSTSAENPHTEAGYYGTGYGTHKGYLSYSSGQLPRGWAVSLTMSYVGGSAQPECTDVESFSYMLNVSKIINAHHTLLFTALGAPEKHDQRNTKLSKDEIDRYGRSHSKNWGLRDGKGFSLSQNNYYKPYFTLQHLMNRGRLRMNNAVYAAIADGGGRWNETQSRSIASYLSDGHIDWTSVLAENTTWSGASTLSPSDGIAAQNIITDYQAGHTQAGLILQGDWQADDHWTLSAGGNYQYYGTWEREQITDLLGADFWYENYAAKSLAGQAGRSSILHVGDYVRTRNGRDTHHGTIYAAGAYENEHINANLGVSWMMSRHQRWDTYNYTGDHCRSDWASGHGWSIKGGLLWKMDWHNSIYINGAWYDRLPYAGAYFASGNNEITPNVRNEKNALGEVGYRWATENSGVSVSAYIAKWMDKTLTSNKYRQLDAGEVRYMITGLDALHQGIELTAYHRFTPWLRLTAFASLADWKWQNDVEATVYDPYSNNALGQISVYADGLHVGDAPQTQLGAGADITMPHGFYARADWKMNGRMYADFEPSKRTDASDRSDSYRIPTYHLLNATLGWTGPFSDGMTLNLFVTGRNLTDATYIERGTDGASHDLDTFRGFWGQERNISFGARLSF